VLALARGGLLDAPGVAAAPPAALAALAAELPGWAERFASQVRGVEPHALGRALGDVLQAVAEDGPVVVAVDDAHCLDVPSLKALAALTRDLAARPVLLVVTAERHSGTAELDLLWSRIGRDVEGVSVDLVPLEPAAIREMARWALPAYDEDALDRVARRVYVDSNGLPLLAVELLHAVAVGLDLGTVRGAWPQPQRTLSQTLPGDLPSAVVAALRVGFRRLSEPAQQALVVVAVLGERVDAPTVGRTAGLSGEALGRALDELEWQRWLTADARGYQFLARIVREVIARDMVSPGQRQRILASAAPA
jgi:predicted ATPase